jgi:hypothetical protein
LIGLHFRNHPHEGNLLEGTVFDAYGQFQANSVSPSGGRQHYDPAVQAMGKAVSVFHNLHWHAQFRRAWSKLTGRSHRLLDLDNVRHTKTIESMHEAGCLTIEVKKIRGSECRSCDFDDEFLPLKSSTGQRWASIYAARLCGQAFPAISVVQVGETYYVRDGHHRVSVARLIGEEYIEAHVLVWQVKGEPAAAPAMSAQLLALS